MFFCYNNLMSNTSPDFFNEIESHKNAEKVPVEVVTLKGDHCRLDVRLRGCFVTDCELTDPTTGEMVNVLRPISKLEDAKLTGSHGMMPVSHSKGVGGRHGYPRWADYHEFYQLDGDDGEKRVSFQAKRSDYGPGLTKVFELTDSRLTMCSIVTNYESDPVKTSLGDHTYFNLPNEDIAGLRVNGKTLEELLGENAESDIMNGVPRVCDDFDGEASIDFPSGHRLKLSASTEENNSDKLRLIVWHKQGDPSICFETTVGFDYETGNEGLSVEQGQTASLITDIELMSAEK